MALLGFKVITVCPDRLPKKPLIGLKYCFANWGQNSVMVKDSCDILVT